MKFLKSKKMFKKVLVFTFAIYAIYTLYVQQIKLASYSNEASYYEEQKVSLIKYQEELTSTKENVNSDEYIETVAREKLDMYLPNERVYVNVEK